MSDPRHGSTNVYLRAGVVLLSVAGLVFLMGFVRDGAPSAAIRVQVAATLAVAGAVLYLIGRIVKRRQ